LKDYEERQMEIFCLVADELQSNVIDESFSEKERIAKVKIKSSISLNDFVRAEIRNAAFEKKEMHFSLQEEMEPVVSTDHRPGAGIIQSVSLHQKTPLAHGNYLPGSS
jgi:hypothetical protein